MDAPQISTLREDDSPPPPRFRVKLVVKERQAEEEDDEPEVDELIDDEPAKPPVNSIVLPPLRDLAKKKSPAKRKSRKSDNKEPNAPPMSWIEANPPQESDPKPIKKLSSSRSKAKTPAKPKQLTLPVDDAGMQTESLAGTAASSPVTTHFEEDIDHPMLPIPPPNDDMNIDINPVPIYPLPTKPFPVQPPPKIGTGFAPVIPLDRNARHTKVRSWRVAHREIRGIAGGRWFARSWVGAKDSEFASASVALKGLESSAAVAIPKLSAVSISAPAAAKTPKRPRTKASSSLATSTTPSRSGSVVPEMSASVRAPTKMRTVLAPPSDAGDSDMTGPPDM